jgi:hypothetical protein
MRKFDKIKSNLKINSDELSTHYLGGEKVGTINDFSPWTHMALGSVGFLDFEKGGASQPHSTLLTISRRHHLSSSLFIKNFVITPSLISSREILILGNTFQVIAESGALDSLLYVLKFSSFCVELKSFAPSCRRLQAKSKFEPREL